MSEFSSDYETIKIPEGAMSVDEMAAELGVSLEIIAAEVSKTKADFDDYGMDFDFHITVVGGVEYIDKAIAETIKRNIERDIEEGVVSR